MVRWIHTSLLQLSVGVLQCVIAQPRVVLLRHGAFAFILPFTSTVALALKISVHN